MKAGEIKKALELVKPGLAKKELMEQATTIIFRDGQARTFNDEVAVSVPLDLEVTGSVPAEPLYAFLNKLSPDSEVKIEEGENEMKLSSGRNRAGIRMDPEIKLPLDEELGDPEELFPIPEGFLKALRSVLFSAARSGHIPILTCVHITEEYLETCDEYRMTRSEVENLGDSFSDVLIVAKQLEKLAGYGPEEVGFTQNWIHFQCKDGVRYSVRYIEAEYPNLDKFLEVEGSEIELPKELEGALDWAGIVTDDTIKMDQSVDVELSRKGMTVRGEGPDGWAEETIRMAYKGDTIQFSSHPAMLKEMARLAQKVTVSDRALKIVGEGFVHVVALNEKE